MIVKIQSGMPPSSLLMLAFGALALVANLYRLRLLWRFRSEDMNMASTFECSRNDAFRTAPCSLRRLRSSCCNRLGLT
ncbi:hypothetical protein [Sphingobium quisquiliarum]|uniref:hypothetical protein n=1 Tax=Sphingobium quisquiliarum TaxID=538379 RepID=UPI001F292045|nr:hypothetical protein [Sphingobium quisquiliarum]